MRKLLVLFFVFLIGIAYAESDVLKFVVLPEKGFESDEYTDFAIKKITEYLSDNGIEYVDFDILEKIRKKVEKVYEEKKGESMSLAQLLTISVGGNVYMELSVKVEEKRLQNLENSYSGIPSVSVKQGYFRVSLSAYDASTGRGLGKTLVSTNKAYAGDTSKEVENTVSILVESGLKDILKKINKYLEGGNLISTKFIINTKGISERDISSSIDGIPGVKMKKRKSMSDDLIEYDVLFKGKIDEFVDYLDDILRTLPGVRDVKIDISGSLVIVKV